MGDSLEVILHSNTSITTLNKKFDIQPNLSSTGAIKEISLAELQNQPLFQVVTISAKVLEIGDTKVLSDGCRLQNILVSDDTDNAELTLGKLC